MKPLNFTDEEKKKLAHDIVIFILALGFYMIGFTHGYLLGGV